METLRYDRACYDLSLQPEQFYRYSISKEFDSDEIYLAKHKIGNITVDNVSDSLATLNNTELELAGNDTNEGDETMGIWCLGHVLNIIFKDVIEIFER